MISTSLECDELSSLSLSTASVDRSSVSGFSPLGRVENKSGNRLSALQICFLECGDWSTLSLSTERGEASVRGFLGMVHRGLRFGVFLVGPGGKRKRYQVTALQIWCGTLHEQAQARQQRGVQARRLRRRTSHSMHSTPQISANSHAIRRCWNARSGVPGR